MSLCNCGEPWRGQPNTHRIDCPYRSHPTYRFTPGVWEAGLATVPVEELIAIETHGGFGDWRCRTCFEPLDPDTEDGRTLLQVVSELVAHLEVCDG